MSSTGMWCLSQSWRKLRSASLTRIANGRGLLGILVEAAVHVVDPLDEATVLRLVFPDFGVLAGRHDLLFPGLLPGLLPGEVIRRITQQREARLADRALPGFVLSRWCRVG